MASFAASGLFFFKFWRSSGEKLFLYFGIACFLIAIERLVLTATASSLDIYSSTQADAAAWVYSIRLAAFLLIFYAIVSKNRLNR